MGSRGGPGECDVLRRPCGCPIPTCLSDELRARDDHPGVESNPGMQALSCSLSTAEGVCSFFPPRIAPIRPRRPVFLLLAKQTRKVQRWALGDTSIQGRADIRYGATLL